MCSDSRGLFKLTSGQTQGGVTGGTFAPTPIIRVSVAARRRGRGPAPEARAAAACLLHVNVFILSRMAAGVSRLSSLALTVSDVFLNKQLLRPAVARGCEPTRASTRAGGADCSDNADANHSARRRDP